MPVSSDPTARLLRLHEADNVLTALAPIDRGSELQIEGESVIAPDPIPLGHKLAAQRIEPGEKVVKYGVPIGRAVCQIARGEYVHTHNLRSDYLPTPGVEFRDSGISGFREFETGQLRDFGTPEIGQISESPEPDIPKGFMGYLRQDGRKGIRNITLVVYLVECAHHVAREIVYPNREHGVHLLGFPGCYPNAYAHRMLRQLCTHPNVGAVLLVSLGCEGFNRGELLGEIRASGRPAELLVIQQEGGTRRTIDEGRAWVANALVQIALTPRVPMRIDELIVGTICGGSDATSGITANPAVGRAFDRLVADGARVIFEETGELIGCERIMAARAAHPELAPELVACVAKAAAYYTTMGHGSFAPGNAEGGLTTQEEKSMGAYSKSGGAPISGILKPGDVPDRAGLYLLDVVPDGEVRWGFPNISDIQEIGELIACGAHLTLFTTGRGSVVGSAISPVIKICANPETYRRLSEDMDVNAGRILDGVATLDEIGAEIYQCLVNTAAGRETASETLGHQEFSLVYKSFEPLGPACFPS